MIKTDVSSSKSNALPSQGSPGSSTGDSFTVFLYYEGTPRRRRRSKSLSHIHGATYSNEEIGQIQERSLIRTDASNKPGGFRSFSRKQKITFIVQALADFLSSCLMGAMWAFFPKQAAEKNLSTTFSGFVFSFNALVMVLTCPIFGKILPKLGAKIIFSSGLLAFGVANLLFGTLQYVSDYTMFTTLCFVSTGLEALGTSAYFTASFVFVVNNFQENTGSVLGTLELFIGLGMSTGPALGGFLYSLGGFSMPFYVFGVILVIFAPISFCLLPSVNYDLNVTTKPTSIFKLMKVPAAFVTASVLVVVSSCWGFLDPTLEPHLRQHNLTPQLVGLIFFLFSALFGISSPAFGWLADEVEHFWMIMAVGLVMSSVSFLLLGPSPYLAPLVERHLWTDLVALSLLGISIALAFAPTFQGLLKSAIDSGCEDSLSTYSVVAGIWSCLHSLGEIIGPSLGGFLFQHYGFAVASTAMAALTFGVSVVTLTFVWWKSCASSNHKSETSGCADQTHFVRQDSRPNPSLPKAAVGSITADGADSTGLMRIFARMFLRRSSSRVSSTATKLIRQAKSQQTWKRIKTDVVPNQNACGTGSRRTWTF